MKRRVIKHGRSTVIVSLPSTWVKKYGIDKGDEIEVTERDNLLEISVDRPADYGKIELDVTGMPPQLVDASIKSAYTYGFDEIFLHFSRPYLEHAGQVIKVRSIVKDSAGELIGMEITSQSDTSCTLKEVSNSTMKEFESVLRRVFLILKEAVGSLVDGSSGEIVMDECTAAKKLVNYCLRCINRHGYPQFRKSHGLYHIIAGIDIMADEILALSREPAEDGGMSREASAAISHLAGFIFKFDMEALVSIEQLYSAAQAKSTNPSHAANIISLTRYLAHHRIALQ